MIGVYLRWRGFNGKAIDVELFREWSNFYFLFFRYGPRSLSRVCPIPVGIGRCQYPYHCQMDRRMSHHCDKGWEKKGLVGFEEEMMDWRLLFLKVWESVCLF